MQYAHDRGIAHRDLKPANILLATDGTPKITDFGLAKSLEADSGTTQSGQIMGTPSYMAPEQAEGRTDIGAPADVYALGAILYDMLTGRPPFAGSSVLDTLEMVRTREPVPPGELTGKLPRDLETVCLKCLQKDIAKRYASAVIYLQTGRVAAAAEELRKAVPILKQLADESPNDAVALFNLTGIGSQLSDAEWRLGNGGTARDLYAAAVELRKKRVGVIEEMRKAGTAKDGDVLNAHYQVADALGVLASAAMRLGDPDAAVENYLASDKGFAALRTAATLDVRQMRSEIQVRLGDARLHQRKPDEAEKHYRAAVAERVKLLELTPESAGLGAMLRGNLAQSGLSHGDFLLMARKDLPAATAEYTTAFDLLAAELKLVPDSLDFQRMVAAAHHRLGYAASRRTGFGALSGTFDAANHFEECLKLREVLAKIDPTDTTAKVEGMLALARTRRSVDAEKVAGELAGLKELDQQVRFQVVCGTRSSRGTVPIRKWRSAAARKRSRR